MRAQANVGVERVDVEAPVQENATTVAGGALTGRSAAAAFCARTALSATPASAAKTSTRMAGLPL
jgi:hypothetical protein